MPKKLVQEEVEVEEEETEEEEQNVAPIVSNKTEKPKKKLSEKQLQALAEGRKRGVEKLKQKGEITRKNQDVQKRVKEIKKQTQIEKTEELEKFADVSQVRQIVEKLNNRFDEFHNKFSSLDNNFRSIDENFRGFLTEKQKRQEEKKSRIVQETVKRELPRAVNDVYLQEKLKKEQNNNPFWGRV